MSFASSIITSAESFLTEHDFRAKEYVNLQTEIESLQKKLAGLTDSHDAMLRAQAILGTVSDETTSGFLMRITDVINRALEQLFPMDPRRVSISQALYRNRYPHFVLELTTSDGMTRTFKQSGTGLGQVVSFLFTVCLIDARGGRRLMVMDELLNGLHPTAKGIVRSLMEALSGRFQFVVVEYGLDVGKQYELVKQGKVASAIPCELPYYAALVQTQTEEDLV